MSEFSTTPVEELLPLYVLGDLDGEERLRVEQALVADEGLRQQVVRWQNDLGEMLAESAGAAELTEQDMERMERRLMRAVENENENENDVGPISSPNARAPGSSESQFEARAHAATVSPSNGSAWMARLALAASLAALALAVWAVWSRGEGASRTEFEQLRDEKAMLADEVAQLRGVLDRNRREIERVSSSLRTLGYPRSEPIILAGLDAAPEATGAAFYRPSAREALFYAFGLPAVDRRSTYQLWYVTGDGPVSAGTFSVDANGEAQLEVAGLPDRKQIALWAVTKEPAGGSAQPTGPMLIRS